MSERSLGVISKLDGAEYKYFPNGMKASLKGLRKYPPQDKHMLVKRSIIEFIRENHHLELFNWVAQKYGHKPVTESALSSIIEGLESNGKDATDINFMLVRFYAEVAKVPVALLTLFTHCASIEADKDSKEDVLDLLTRVRKAVDWLIFQKDPRGKGRKQAFHRPLDGRPGEYEGRVSTLYEMADVYNKNSKETGLSSSEPTAILRR